MTKYEARLAMPRRHPFKNGDFVGQMGSRESSIAEFEPIWLAGQDEKLEEYDYAFVDWEDRDGLPYAVIDVSLPVEAYE